MYQKKSHGWSQHLDFMAFDIAALELALLISYLIFRVGHGNVAQATFVSLFLILPFLDLAVMLLSDTYHSVIRRDPYHEFTSLLQQTVYLSLILGAYMIFTQVGIAGARFAFFGTIFFYFFLCYAVRTLWKSHLQHRLHIKNRTGMLVVAELNHLPDVLTKLISHNYNSYRFVGIALLDPGDVRKEGEDLLYNIMEGDDEVRDMEIVACRDDLINYLTKNWVDEVYLDVREEIPIDLVNQIMSMGITVHMAINEIDRIIARHKNVEWICGQAAITASLGYVSGRDLFLKRVMDVVGGLVGCLITGILTIFIGPAIYLASPGPIFFHQTRIGENGREFEMYKFRSMYMDAEKRKEELMKNNTDDPANRLMFKMDHDPRIIGMKQRKDGTWKKGIGGWIRDLSLDEFPQFFNVLKGDMSLVGTRPPTLDEWNLYKPAYRARMSAKPGVTGMWQVSGRSSIRDFEKVVQLDREYIENWSLRLDWQILIRTVWVVLMRKGAM